MSRNRPAHLALGLFTSSGYMPAMDSFIATYSGENKYINRTLKTKLSDGKQML